MIWLPVSCFFSLFDAIGSCTSTPRESMGVTTMKMISRTSTTSTSGVTLISAITPADGRGLTDLCSAPFLPRFACMLFPALFEDVVDQLRRDVVHVDHES